MGKFLKPSRHVMRRYGRRTIMAGELATYINENCHDGARVYVEGASGRLKLTAVVNADLDGSHTGRPILILKTRE